MRAGNWETGVRDSGSGQGMHLQGMNMSTESPSILVKFRIIQLRNESSRDGQEETPRNVGSRKDGTW